MKFDNDEPLARNLDLNTSHLAGENLTKSGKRDSHKSQVLNWLQDNEIDSSENSLTSREISEKSGIIHERCHKRLSDLERDGFVVKARQRECSVTHEQAWTWMIRTEYSEMQEMIAEVTAISAQGELF